MKDILDLASQNAASDLSGLVFLYTFLALIVCFLGVVVRLENDGRKFLPWLTTAVLIAAVGRYHYLAAEANMARLPSKVAVLEAALNSPELARFDSVEFPRRESFFILNMTPLADGILGNPPKGRSLALALPKTALPALLIACHKSGAGAIEGALAKR